MNVVIIAEAGVNHNGDLGRALPVDAAADAGADFVKPDFRSGRGYQPPNPEMRLSKG